jgi:hypothetical protein
MSLTPEQVAHLLALPDKKRGGPRKSGPNVSDRTHKTWFLLAHKLFDEETRELAVCSNPECPDTRSKESAVIADVNGILMSDMFSGRMEINLSNQSKLGE